MIYSRVRGPGTVGIDANVLIEELVQVVLEALEYYGVYAISRYYTYQHTPTLFITNHHNSILKDNYLENNQQNYQQEQVLDSNNILKEITNQMNTNISTTTTSSTPTIANNITINKFSSPKELPQLPEDMIINRRISMGVYGVFTKF